MTSGSDGSQSIRDRLDDECTECGKSKEDADEVAPVAHGRYAMGPAWYCGECLATI